MTDTVPLSNTSSNVSIHPRGDICSLMSPFVLTAFNVTYILFLLPLFVVVFYVGYQRWRKHRSGSTTVINSHSDIFTFNMVSLEFFGILGTWLYSYGVFCKEQRMMMAGLYTFTIISPAQTLFHLLTCVDRYLAVVYPITYRGLREARTLRIRNVVIGCVWIVCLMFPGTTLLATVYMAINVSLLTLSTVVASFCSISVLLVLTRPGPGEAVRNRDQSKQRAFHSIMAITAALFTRFFSIMVLNVLLLSSVISYNDVCAGFSASIWFSLPSSLVLPLLFLHRAGKLQCSKKNMDQLEKQIRPA